MTEGSRMEIEPGLAETVRDRQSVSLPLYNKGFKPPSPPTAGYTGSPLKRFVSGSQQVVRNAGVMLTAGKNVITAGKRWTGGAGQRGIRGQNARAGTMKTLEGCLLPLHSATWSSGPASPRRSLKAHKRWDRIKINGLMRINSS